MKVTLGGSSEMRDGDEAKKQKRRRRGGRKII